MYPLPIQQLINAFVKLPGVGQRTAERFVFHLLKAGKKDAADLANALQHILETVKSCATCWDFSDRSPCAICADIKRDQTTICVVEEPQALQTIEKTSEYHGLYHVLRGTIQPDDEESVPLLKINELLKRVEAGAVKEVILALNPDLTGETTMMFLQNRLKEVNPRLTISRLARGLPMGSNLQYADEITLGSALKHRTQN